MMANGRRLLVEGLDDQKSIESLCKAHAISLVGCTIEPTNGIDALLDKVPTTLKAGADRIAAVIDADEDATHRWIQLRDRLRRSGFQGVPDQPAADGIVVDFDLQTRIARLGVWIMPNNSLPGMLEDFLVWLVPKDDRMLPHVDQFLDAIPTGERLFPDQHKAKARIHSYLAVQKEPGKPMGQAITCTFLDAHRDGVVGPFLAWLRRVLLDDLPGNNG